MSDPLENLVREIVAENRRRRTEWSDLLGEVTTSLAAGQDIPLDRFEELLGGIDDADGDRAETGDGSETGDGAGQDG